MCVQTLDPTTDSDAEHFPSGEVEAPLSMSYEEYLDWLDEDTHAEWADGTVIMHSPVSKYHSKLCVFLNSATLAWTEADDLGDVLCDPFLMKTRPDLPARVPDILFVARQNRDRLKTNLLEGPADLVVEIVSPESRGGDRGDKYYEYEQGGVREYWLLDPERRRAEYYTLGSDARYTLASLDGEGRFHSVVLAGLWLQVEWLWQEPLPTLRSVLQAWNITTA